jgi:hypothetical protein
MWKSRKTATVIDFLSAMTVLFPLFLRLFHLPLFHFVSNFSYSPPPPSSYFTVSPPHIFGQNEDYTEIIVTCLWQGEILPRVTFTLASVTVGN